MDSRKLNDWLTLAANVGVVIGLGMLIFELKHTSDLSEVSAYQTRMTEISETSRAFALSEDLAEIYERLRTEGVAALAPAELGRVKSWEMGKIVRMQAQFYQYQRGFLDEVSAHAMLRVAAAHLQLWDELGVVSDDPAFRQAAEAMVREP